MHLNDATMLLTDHLVCPLNSYATFYSQGKQDEIVWRSYFTTNQTPSFCYGTFVEAGAFDGVNNSNTLFFEEHLGWSGLCIEPNPAAFGALSINRPNCRNIPIALGNSSGVNVTLHIHTKYPVLSKVQLSIDNNTRQDNIVVQQKRLDDILVANHMPHVNFMSLDVEDYEYKVLCGINFSIVSVDVITIEVHEWNKDAKNIHALLTNANFVLDQTIGDEIWVNKDFLKKVRNT